MNLSLVIDFTMSDPAEEDAPKDDTADADSTAPDAPPEEGAEEETAAAASTKDASVAASYSTRGRGVVDDPLERLARQVLGDLSTTAPPRLPASSSFLNDAITEEERRTRTRYIPAVEGMHGLRKHQVKADLLQCRVGLDSSSSAMGGASGAAADADAGMALDENPYDYSSSNRSRSNNNNNNSTAANAFCPPALKSHTPHHSSSSSAAASVPPGRVTFVAAFDPPRPPESIGSKKQHRLARWERQPADVEQDLQTYRKTVQRTREELHRVQNELALVEAVDAQLRQSLHTQLYCLTREYQRMYRDFLKLQQECVQVAGLNVTRTRSSSRAMTSTTISSNNNNNKATDEAKVLWKDVLATIQSKKMELQAKGITVVLEQEDAVMADDATTVTSSSKTGVGGLAVANFGVHDVTSSTTTTATAQGMMLMASEWIVPGDLVQTPYGEGIVKAVLPVERLGGSSKVIQSNKDANAMEVDDEPNKKKETVSATTTGGGMSFLIPRIAVQLPFGIGYFAVGTVGSKEQPVTTYSDERLTQRWKGMMETGMLLGDMVDMAAMTGNATGVAAETTESDQVSPNMETDDALLGTTTAADDLSERVSPSGIHTMIPPGLQILPTSAGRGAMLTKLTVDELDQEIRQVVFDGKGPLDWTSHPGVIPTIRAREGTRQDTLRLQGTVLQLKNQLYRQRRLRLMNERTYASAQERANRVEALVSEMRTDLKTLKRRLDEDVLDLGMTEEQAERILKQYYDSLDYKHAGDVSPPPKRARKPSLAPGLADNGMTDEDEDDVVQSLQDMHAGGATASAMDLEAAA